MNKKYTAEQIEFIKNNVTGRSYKELTALFNQHFGTNLTVSTVTATSFRYGFKNGRDTRFDKGCVSHRFKKGHVPVNKGTKGYMKPNKTSFKKGHMPQTYRPVGSERIDADGYRWVKTQDPKTWRMKHVLLWEQVNGAVPKGHIVIFADGDKSNITLDNLLLVSRGQLLMINKFGLIQNNAELTKVGVTIADVHLKIGERRRKSKERKRSNE